MAVPPEPSASKVVCECGAAVAENGVLRCYNALNGQWQHFAIPKNPACKVCGGHKKAEEAT